MYLCVFFGGRIGRGIVDFGPKHRGGLPRFAFLVDSGRERLHPDHRAWFRAALQERICCFAIVFQVKVVDKSEIFVESPVVRISPNSTPQQLNSLLGSSRAAWWRLAQKH